MTATEGLVERLRDFECSDALGNGDFALMDEAAAEIERLSALAAAVEREECARVADNLPFPYPESDLDFEPTFDGTRFEIAARIRARAPGTAMGEEE